MVLRLRGGGKKRKKKNYTTPKKTKHKKKKVKLAVLKYYKVSGNNDQVTGIVHNLCRYLNTSINNNIICNDDTYLNTLGHI